VVLPDTLADLIDYRWPDALWVAAERHSERCITFWVLDLDYKYTEWIAHLSLDDRWTLSPVGGPWENGTGNKYARKGRRKWRKRARRLRAK
jgi:hypothetical protein